MKDYIELYKEHDDSYYNILKRPITVLRFLRGYFEIDYKSYYQEYLFNHIVSSFNAYFVYNDQKNKVLYIGLAEWELDEEVDAPLWEEFHDYVNETNSCKITYDNFNELIKKWIQLKKDLPSFALIYRDNFDWIDCKGFDTQEAMEGFVKNYKDEVVH
ncbi:MAG: hypothetical protein ACXWL5_05175 [Candidatus Chromulinivorax sp.]